MVQFRAIGLTGHGLAHLRGHRYERPSDCRDGEAGARLLDQRAYDVVLCDVRMPKMTGAAFYYRAAARHRAVLDRFAFISGDTLNPDLQRFVDEHRVPLLEKPFSAVQLDALLARLTEDRPAGAGRDSRRRS